MIFSRSLGIGHLGAVIPQDDRYCDDIYIRDPKHMGVRIQKYVSYRPSPSMLATIMPLLALIPLGLSSPLSSRQASTVICGQFDSLVEGPFTLFNDQFGSGSAASGSQCAQVTSLGADSVSWKTNWTWADGASGGGVKSFANIQQDQGVGVQLSAISSIPVRLLAPYE